MTRDVFSQESNLPTEVASEFIPLESHLPEEGLAPVSQAPLKKQEQVKLGLPLENKDICLKSSRFPKSARLLKSSQYKQLHRHSNRLFGQTIVIQFGKGRSSSAKLGITVSKKFGKAHKRNRFKRIVREAFRELYPLLPPSLEINISPQKNVNALFKQTLLLELKEMLDKILKSSPCSLTLS